MSFEVINIVTGIVIFALGNISGYLFHDFLKSTLNMSENASKNFLLVVVTLIWAIAMIVSVLNSNYEVPIAVHGILGAIVGFFFWRPKE